MSVCRSFVQILPLIVVISLFLGIAGCFENNDLRQQWEETEAALSAHRTSLDNYLLVYTIGIDLWNIELGDGSVNSRILRTQLAREEGFLADVSMKHRTLSGAVTRFFGAAQTLKGGGSARALEVAWDLRVYDEEMWNAQNALIGRISSLSQYLDLADEGKGATAEALSYLESANALSRDAAGAIGRADAARARAESAY